LSPQEIFEEAQEATQRLLPEKSKEHYEKEFAEFNKWREQRQVGVINEEVMLSYFYSSLFDEFVCKLGLFWHAWAILKRE
jgi:hypothetical protein